MILELGEFDEVSLGWPLVNEFGEIETVIPELWPDRDHEARARHIVHCVNNHERLVRMVERLTHECDLHDVPAGIMEDARALLAALEAEKGGEL